MQYRKDIDGLRCLAILPVVFYHAGVEEISGGFVGVDIFFVISGYLITSLILEQSENGVFSYTEFYYRRAKRLLPALFLVIVLSFLTSLFILMPNELKEFSFSSLMATIFISNIYFDLTIDYFSPASETLPLLHTWSLAVEEQFYLIWPVIIIFLAQLIKEHRMKLTLFLLLLVCMSSFLTSLVATEKYSQHAFYLMPFRLWELGAGGALVFLRRYTPSIRGIFSNMLFLLGLLLVVRSMIMIDSDDAFPGVTVLPVVLGTFLLLWVGDSPGQRVSQIFHIQPLAYIGKISYSLYLFHWPIFAFYRIWYGGESNPDIPFLLIALAFLMAALSYHLVECPIRFKWTRPVVWAGVASNVLIVGSMCFVVYSYQGFTTRVPTEPDYLQSKEIMNAWDCPKQQMFAESVSGCVFGAEFGSAKKKYLLWGDSHASHFAPLLEYAIKDKNISIVLVKTCPAFIDNFVVKRWYKKSMATSEMCGERHDAIVNWLTDNPDSISGVIMASAWSGYPDSLFSIDHEERSIQQGSELIGLGLKSLIKKINPDMSIWLLGDVPRPNVVLTQCGIAKTGWIYQRISRDECKSLSAVEIRARHKPTLDVLLSIKNTFSNVSLVDPVRQLCDLEQCPIYIDSRLMYMDGNHLRRNLTEHEKRWLVQKIGLDSMFSG